MLEERTKQILTSVINEYVLTAEPVGSRKLAKKYNINLSSATIRNVMSDLEDMGLLHQPHTSAGRIPTVARIARTAPFLENCTPYRVGDGLPLWAKY